jgi:hypothetical protein
MTITPVHHEDSVETAVPGELLIKEARRAAHQRRMVMVSLLVAVAVLLAVIVGSLRSDGPVASKTDNSSPGVNAAALPVCARLTNVSAPRFSMGIQEWARNFALKNSASVACQLNGYPTLKFISTSGKVMPFHYVHSRALPFDMTTSTPARLVVKPHATVYFEIANQSCQYHPIAASGYVEITPPGSSQTVSVRTNGTFLSREYLCPNAGAYSNVVEVTPIEPSVKKLVGTS